MSRVLAFLLCLCVCHVSAQQVFRYNQTGGLTSLDPADAAIRSNIWAVSQLYNGLFRFNKNTELTNDLLQEWEVSDDGLAYTYSIRTGVYFHDNPCFQGGKGREVTAQDFVFSFQRLLKNGYGAWIFADNVITKPDGSPADTCFKAVSKYTLKIYLQRPCRQFNSMLAMPYCFVVPQEAVTYYGRDFDKNPVGTGAFKFQSWAKGEKLTFVKNEHYWERDYKGNLLPYLDGVEISFIDDRNEEFAAFSTGKLHVLFNLAEASISQILEKNGAFKPAFAKRFKTHKQDYMNTEYVGFYLENLPENPLANLKLRQALACAIDKQKLVAKARNNLGSPAAAGFVPKAMPSYDSESVASLAYSPKQARQLLAEAGFPKGKGLPTLTLHTYLSDNKIADMLQASWQKLGLNVRIERLQFAEHRALVQAGKANIFRGSWLGDYPDAENYLMLGYSKFFPPFGVNFSRFKNVAYDQMFRQLREQDSPFAAQEICTKMDQMLMDNVVMIPLYYDAAIHITQPFVERLEVNAMNILYLKEVQFLPIPSREK